MVLVKLSKYDALIIVDMQNDFMPGGALPVPKADEIIPTLNKYIALFESKNLKVIATRDWHPPNHISFKTRGGPWPPHCIQGTKGAEFHPDLKLPKDVVVISKATEPDKEAYSGFEATNLDKVLKEYGIKRLFIGGVATDYCVKATVLDGLRLGYTVLLLLDGIKGVDVNPGDVEKAINEMLSEGAIGITLVELLKSY
ncbi:MAG TPA: bifunctional nicotinamidase/pyrazinamidase [Acidilobales archaeon]|nr:MAG: nicotinamidase [Desulfurococcales archaeon ex4484_42]RLG86853.1 MAG: bifunctional nicotinamidase/pyrazinamidase [Thermoprotei archaeon]HDD26522.1 bifunctional nicotinamidase/pyrazinamidase [Acidilobales archaeon]